MEPTALISRIDETIPGAVLERTAFGRTGRPCAWIDSRHLRKAGEIAAAAGFEDLENLSMMQMEGTLVLTYFLLSRDRAGLVLRCSRKIEAHGREIDFDSVADLWRMAEPLEIETQELFGARFIACSGDRRGAPAWPGRRRLAEKWAGFPLRKEYMFPTEFLGIRHARKPEEERAGHA